MTLSPASVFLCFFPSFFLLSALPPSPLLHFFTPFPPPPFPSPSLHSTFSTWLARREGLTGQQVFYMYYTDKRHETGGIPKAETQNFPLQEWRMRDRLKTVSAALVMCLNLGVDPPGIAPSLS